MAENEQQAVEVPGYHTGIPVVARLLAVMDEVGAIGRGGKMQQGETYNYRKHDDVLAEVPPALIRNGLATWPTSCDVTYELRTSRKGNPMQWVSVTVHWQLGSVDGDIIEGETVGEAIDASDKATNKAQTAAFKNWLTQLL